MQNAALLAARVVLGGYLIAHGSQKAFGALKGPGLDAAGAGFEQMGLSPGKNYATLASVSEITGGVLTATGIAHPVGPALIGSAMITAGVVHKPAGPMGAHGGYEQALTNLAIAGALAAAPGKYKIGPSLPKPLAIAFTVGAAAITAFTATQVIRAQNANTASPSADDTQDEAAVALAENEAVVDVIDEAAHAK